MKEETNNIEKHIKRNMEEKGTSLFRTALKYATWKVQKNPERIYFTDRKSPPQTLAQWRYSYVSLLDIKS